MKKLSLLWIVIIGLTLVISSCKKEESDDDEASTASSCATDSTASGSITVGSETMSGVYLSTCTDISSSAGTSMIPSDAKSVYVALVVTGDAAISQEFLMYTDTACSTPSLTWKLGSSDFTVGSASGSNYAVTYKKATVKIKPSTDAAKSHMDSFAASVGSSATFAVGAETTITESLSTEYNLINVTSTTVQTGDPSESATPTSLDNGNPPMTKACE